jgi:hypothetical protein
MRIEKIETIKFGDITETFDRGKRWLVALRIGKQFINLIIPDYSPKLARN